MVKKTKREKSETVIPGSLQQLFSCHFLFLSTIVKKTGYAGK